MLHALTLLAALSLAPRWVSGNYSLDLYGPSDARMPGQTCAGTPCIWGHADSGMLPIVFHPPAGYRVRVMSLRGDLIAWIKSLPGDAATPAESAAGVLGGFQTSTSAATPASDACDYCVDGCPLYIQDSVTEKVPKTRAPFAYENIGQVLDSDNTLRAKMAAWLNTTGKPIHIELTYSIQFRYESTNPGGGQ